MAYVNPGIAMGVQTYTPPRLMDTAGKAVDIQNALVAQDAAKQEIEQSKYAQAIRESKDALRFVATPEQYMAWHESNHQNPVLGSLLSKMGITADQSRAKIMAQLQQPGGLESLIQQSAASADQMANIMEGRINAMAKQREAAAGAARDQQLQARMQALLTGGQAAPAPNAPTAQVFPVAPPVDTGVYEPGTPGAINQMYAQSRATPTPALNALTAQPTAAATPAATSTAARTEADNLRAAIGRFRQAAVLDPANSKKYVAAADQLQKQLELVSPEARGSLSGDAQAFELLKQSGYTGDFKQYKEDFAGFEFKPDANGVLFKINKLTGAASPVEMKGGKPLTPKDEAKAAPTVDELSTPLSETNLFKVPQKTDKVTEDERKGAAALQRVLSAADQIAGVTATTPSAAAPGALETAAAVFPLWDSASSELQNWARPVDRQIVAAAQRDMIDALLFLATGAAYNKEQLQGQIDSYLPKYTDKSKKVLDAKRQRLIELIQGAKARAGGAWTPELDAKVENLIATSFPDTGGADDVPPPPEGVDDEVKRLWQFMTPEERKAWQQ